MARRRRLNLPTGAAAPLKVLARSCSRRAAVWAAQCSTTSLIAEKKSAAETSHVGRESARACRRSEPRPQVGVECKLHQGVRESAYVAGPRGALRADPPPGAEGSRPANQRPGDRRPSPHPRPSRTTHERREARRRRLPRKGPQRPSEASPCVTTRPMRSPSARRDRTRAVYLASADSSPTRCSVPASAGRRANASRSSRIPSAAASWRPRGRPLGVRYGGLAQDLLVELRRPVPGGRLESETPRAQLRRAAPRGGRLRRSGGPPPQRQPIQQGLRPRANSGVVDAAGG